LQTGLHLANTRVIDHGATNCYEIYMAAELCDDPSCTVDHAPKALRDARSLRDVALAILPSLACLGCPACLSAMSAVLAGTGAVGLQGFAMSETTHHVALGAAVLMNVAVAMWRSRRMGSWTPVWFLAPGVVLLAVNSAGLHVEWVEWLGVLGLFVGASSGALWKKSRPASEVRVVGKAVAPKPLSLRAT
jgi:hypothetical protein